MRIRGIGSPPLAASLLLLWLLLAGSLALGHWLLGAVLALLVPRWSERLRERRARPQRPWTMLRLAVVVLHDIVVSNLQVAGLILGPSSRIRPGFVWIPLEVANPYGITALASIITMTPGTLSCDLTEDHRYLLVHCLSLEDPETIVAQIKARYERPLLEIFPS